MPIDGVIVVKRVLAVLVALLRFAAQGATTTVLRPAPMQTAPLIGIGK